MSDNENQQRGVRGPSDDVEGHMPRLKGGFTGEDVDDLEGHAVPTGKAIDEPQDGDDVNGHGRFKF